MDITQLKKTEPDLQDVPDQRLQFFDLYIETGDAKQAWLDAGYSQSNTSKAMSVIRDNWRVIEKMIRTRIGSHVPMALNGIINLAQNAKQESVRLKALQDILSRAGYDGVMKIEHTEKAADEMDNKEFEVELQRLLKRSNDSQESLH
mgnify:CR=1 FL=1